MAQQGRRNRLNSADPIPTVPAFRPAQPSAPCNDRLSGKPAPTASPQALQPPGPPGSRKQRQNDDGKRMAGRGGRRSAARDQTETRNCLKLCLSHPSFPFTRTAPPPLLGTRVLTWKDNCTLYDNPARRRTHKASVESFLKRERFMG